jgi:serine/threonine protein kinase
MGISGSATQTGGRLGRYELLARLATGGMGEIFLARLEGAEGFEKLYVVKRILAHLADDARFRQMLVAEARIASKMSHPNICQVFELGEDQSQLYIVMEYLEGVSLLPLMRRFSKSQQQLDLGFIAGVFQQTTDAMNYAHELKDRSGDYLGIIHRDVTPSNIFLTESGVAKVLDFGIAKAKGASTQTQEGTVKGKYAYMAPEQLKGAAIDRRVDIFAMGVVLYEMLALRRLFQRKTDYLTFRAVMEQPIPDIRRYRPDVPDAVADAMMRALDRDPNNRFETARQFGSAVLDGLAQFKRPWSQGELGDFVRHYFADEIHKRSTQVAQVISRTGASNVRATMPLLAHPDDQTQIDDGDDDEFPSVETDVDAPPWSPRPATPPVNPNGPQNTADFSGQSTSGTPPPFGAETTGSAPALQPLRGAPVMMPGTNTAPIMVVPQRSVVWPVVAVLMVLVTGGALFLVWKQTQNKQPALVIERESNPPPIPTEPVHEVVADAGSAGVAVEPPDVGSGSATTGKGSGTKAVKIKPPVSRPKTYDAAIQSRVGDLNSCVVDHRDAIVAGDMFALIKVGASGTAKNVRITPDSVNSSTLGACLRNVLMTTVYPTAGSDVDIKIPLNARTKR